MGTWNSYKKIKWALKHLKATVWRNTEQITGWETSNKAKQIYREGEKSSWRYSP